MDEVPEPHVEPWPARDRALFIAAAAAAPWVAVAWGARLMGWL